MTAKISSGLVPAILEVAPYMSRSDALRSIVRSHHNADSEFVGNITTQYHDNNRDSAAWEYELETGLTITPAFFNGVEDWIADIKLDVAAPSIVEIYTPFGLRSSSAPVFKSAKDMPHKYAKMQFNMYASGATLTDFFQWTPHGYNLEVVEKDQQWLDDNLPDLRQFYSFCLSELDNSEHLEPLRKEVNTEAARLLLDEYDQLQEAMDNVKERLDEVKVGIIDAAGDRDCLIWGRKVTKVEKKGSVSYAKVVKDHAKGIDLEPYRGKSSVSWKIT